MSDQSPPGSPPGPQRRRSSFAELFTSRPSMTPSTTSPATSASASLPRPIHGRGASLSTSTKGLGVGIASPDQSPFSAFAKHRHASVSTSSGTGSPEFRNSFGDEAAVLEEDDTNVPMNTPSSPSFARRMSFGAQALRDVKQSNGGGSGSSRRPSSSLFTWKENTAPTRSPPSPPGPSNTVTARGEGFNWPDALRDKTKRSPSFSSSANPFAASHPARTRSASITAVEPPKEIPKPAPIPTPIQQKFKKPDHLGERMLRGDFMMD